MTDDLAFLAKVVGEMTRGDWRPSIQTHKDSPIILYVGDRETAGMYTGTFGAKNCAAIATLGTCADEILKVIEAAEYAFDEAILVAPEAAKSLGLVKVEDALTALRQKLQGCM